MRVFNAMDLPEVDMDAFRHRVRVQGKNGAIDEIPLSDASTLFEQASVASPTAVQDIDPSPNAGGATPFGLGDD